jgi:gamma-glutamyl-gamma-aminobutyrate hydrolase PuuD
MLRVLIFFLLLFPSLEALATTLQIGCSYHCDHLVQRSLSNAARRLGLKVNVTDLSQEKKINWDELDGLIIPGGADIDPRYYLPYVEAELQAHTRALDHLVEYSLEGEERDPFEYALMQEYYRSERLKNFPLLGLCRGMQMMAVAQGIPLYVDIQAELGLPTRRNLYDQIRVVDPASLIHQLMGAAPFRGYKWHHQGIRVPYYREHQARWPEVKVTAYSHQFHIAEVLEVQGRPAMGVQFHPENDQNWLNRQVFDWYLKSAKQRRDERKD